MSIWLVAFVGLIYLAVCVNEWLAGNTGTAIMFFGYSLANVGVILSMWRF